jgi:hypothetical protein
MQHEIQTWNHVKIPYVYFEKALVTVDCEVGYSHIPDVSCDNFTLMRTGVHENPLDQVIPVLITSNYGR